MRKPAGIKIRTLLFLLSGLLLFPALLFCFIGFLRAHAQQENLEQVRMKIDEINQDLNRSVVAPFYMSPRSIDPCDPETLKRVQYPDDWAIEIESRASYERQYACEWAYYRNDVLIAVDSWNEFDRKLGLREYFQGASNPMGQDIFFVLDNINRVQCVKQREYEDLGVIECYTESGALISIDPINNAFSPLPPMLYWFSYR